MVKASVLIALSLTISFSGSASIAQEAGKAIDVKQTAELQTSAGKKRLRRGSTVSLGDTVITSRRGQVQLEFSDGTRMVVGPKSKLLIEEYLLTQQNTASKFTVSALGGTFRFISGRSPKKAYKIRTPSATLGIRGTKFDLAVRDDGTVGVAVIEGATEMCGGGRCIVIQDSCSVGINFLTRKTRLMQEEQARNTALLNNFPYIENQRSLRRENRFDYTSCGTELQTRIFHRQIDRANPLLRQERNDSPSAPSTPSAPNPNPGDPPR